jgi:NADPH:quinone reductase-like Zn-dependent oxidoreductase
MKQCQLRKRGETFVPEVVEVEAPHPGERQVLVRVRAASLNYRDHMIASAAVMGDKAEGLVPLSDGAGVVEAVGSGTTRFRAGDRVAGIFFQTWLGGRFRLPYHDFALGGAVPGMLSEYVVLSENGLVAIPDYLSDEEAATLPCAAVTAWQALFRRGELQADESVLALGTGGVSVFALQFARAAGAAVFITSSSDEKLERARGLGAAQTINYRTTPEWGKEVWRMTEKRGVDHVIEVGGRDTYERSLASVAAGGHIHQIGVLSGAEMRPSLFPLQVRNATINGIYVGSRDDFEAMLRFMDEHQIHPVIDQIFPFGEAHDAYAHLASGNHFGKIAIRL